MWENVLVHSFSATQWWLLKESFYSLTEAHKFPQQGAGRDLSCVVQSQIQPGSLCQWQECCSHRSKTTNLFKVSFLIWKWSTDALKICTALLWLQTATTKLVSGLLRVYILHKTHLPLDWYYNYDAHPIYKKVSNTTDVFMRILKTYSVTSLSLNLSKSILFLSMAFSFSFRLDTSDISSSFWVSSEALQSSSYKQMNKFINIS